MSSFFDALGYTSLPNNITDPTELFNLAATNSYFSSGPGADTSAGIMGQLNTYLSQSTIKRACCMGTQSSDNPNSYTINVRIPVPTGVTGLSPNAQTYNYYDKPVDVPKSMCTSQWTPGSTGCNIFYTAYCSNMYDFYKDESGTTEETLNAADWNAYKPECACVGPHIQLSTTPAGQGVAPVCYVPGCLLTQNTAYYDPHHAQL